MTISRTSLCVVYAVIGLLAFIDTWGNITGLLHQQGFIHGTLQFWQEVMVNGPSRFITVDTLFLSLSVIVWMTLEANRLKMRGLWLYVLFGLLVAISLAVPLFMIHRERRLAALDPNSSAGTLRSIDLIALALLAIACVCFGIRALML
jgi:hypothetical protein